MKRPIVRVNRVPYGYKHSGKCFAMHIDFSQIIMDNAYDAYVKKSVIQYIEGLFISTSPEVIDYQERIIMVFRDNIDKRMLQVQMNKILQEVMYHTQNKIDITYGFNDVIMLKEGLDPSFLVMHKCGEEYSKHALYTQKLQSVPSKNDNNNITHIVSYNTFKGLE